MAREKDFMKPSEQWELQKERGLKVPRRKKTKMRNKAIHHFGTKNYFNFINGFESLMIEDRHSTNKKYMNNINVLDFERAYKVDKLISRDLFSQISNIEQELKSKIAYYFCEKYCHAGYQDNLKYQDIQCYTIPMNYTGKPKFTEYFYKFDNRNNTINNRKTHLFFKTHDIRIETVKLEFTGDIVTVPKKPNQLLLVGQFEGTIKNVSPNLYSGAFLVNTNKSKMVLTPGLGVNLVLKSEKGFLKNLSYSDYCKIKYPHISSYKYPPLWVVINTLMLNQLLTLFHGLDIGIQNSIAESMGKFDISIGGREDFLNSVEIMIEIRNVISHAELVTRFRTSSSTSINTNLISNLNLNPKARNYVLKLNDTIKILSQFNSFNAKRVTNYSNTYIFRNKLLGKNNINKNYIKRIGL